MPRTGRPRRCVEALSVDYVDAIRKSAFSKRAFYHRFVKPTCDISERGFYRMMSGQPARPEYLRAAEEAVETFILEPLEVISRLIDRAERAKGIGGEQPL